MDVFPGEQQKILLENRLDIVLAESACRWCRGARDTPRSPADTSLSSRASRPDSRGRCLRDKTARAADRSRRAAENFLSIERARSAAAVETRIRAVDGRLDAMPHPQASLVPPAFGEPGFFAQLGWIGKMNLAGDREHLFVREAIEKGREKIALHAHVAVEQDDDVVARMLESAIRSAAEAEIFVERDQADLGKRSEARTPRCHPWNRCRPRSLPLPGAVRPRRSRMGDIFRAGRGRSSWESRCWPRRVSGCVSAGSGLRGRKRADRDRSRRARAPRAIKNTGETSASGSPIRMRHMAPSVRRISPIPLAAPARPRARASASAIRESCEAGAPSLQLASEATGPRSCAR